MRMTAGYLPKTPMGFIFLFKKNKIMLLPAKPWVSTVTSPNSGRYGQWLRNGKEINQEEEEKKTLGQRI